MDRYQKLYFLLLFAASIIVVKFLHQVKFFRQSVTFSLPKK